MTAVDLLVIETEAFDLTLRGPAPEAVLGGLEHLHAGATAQTEVIGRVQRASVYHRDLASFSGLAAHPPLLFEEHSYELVIEKKADGRLAFWHENPRLRTSIAPVGRAGRVWSGVLQFQGEVGESDLVIIWNGVRALTVRLEVFPSKLDYRRDFEQLLREVHSQVYGLAFEVLTRTYRRVASDAARAPSHAEWYAVLAQWIDGLERAVRHVGRSPHHGLTVEERLRPIRRTIRPNAATRRWLIRHPAAYVHVIGQPGAVPGPVQPDPDLPTGRPICIPERRKVVTYDTPENRFVRFVLERIASRLRELGHLASHPDGVAQRERSHPVFDLERRVRRLLATPFLRGVGQFRPESSISLALQFGAGYREILLSYFRLLRGLSIEGRALRIGMKSVHELYEYWCFLRLREMIARRLPMVSQDLVRTRSSGLSLVLQKGAVSRCVFEGPSGTVELGYNAQADIPSPTTPQRPDLLFTLDRRTEGGRHRFIFDAKYRVERSPDYVQRYRGPGPKEDDVNTMHRYRDAFLAGDPAAKWYSRDTFGACILFPWSGGFDDHPFRQSLREVGIGALPFLPGATGMVEAFLDELLGRSDAELVARAPLPREHDVFWRRRYREEPVLVGTLGRSRHRRRLEFAKQRGYYHIPAARLAAHQLGFQYVAFFADGGIEEYAQVRGVCVVPERELPSITELRPFQTTGGEGLYYRVDLVPESWRRLPRRITNPTKRTMTFLFTTLEALLTSETLGELRMVHENERRVLEALRAAGVAYTTTETEPDRWEIVLVETGARLRRQATGDAVEVWLPGAQRPQRVAGAVVRGRPEAVVALAGSSRLKGGA